MDFFGFYYLDIDLIIRSINVFLNQDTLSIVLQTLATGGWLFFAYYLIHIGLHYYEEYRQEKNVHNWKWVLLAIDIPAQNVQTPLAVEQMFAQLAGSFDAPNIADKYHDGYKQRWFSFEIISIEGYIQFLIWTEEAFRDLVEASVYAQYPDAEITEVEDYVKSAPDHFPDNEYDMWAADFALAEHDAYPIRTYREFEHSISKDTVLKDPMGTFLESFSRLGPGEQMWFQIICEPTNNHWKEKIIDKVKELIGDSSLKPHGGKNIVDKTLDLPLVFLEKVGDQVFNREASSSESHDDSGEPNKLKYLTPGQVKIVEAMEHKISKIGFKTKMRGLYLARKEVFHKERGVSALLGAINQFNMPSANSIVPSFGIGASYAFKHKRIAQKKNLLMKAYKKRKLKVGSSPFVLNIEELATLWHFPMSHVKTPLVQKAGSKRAEPPSSLPVESIFSTVVEKPSEGEKVEIEETGGYMTDSGSVVKNSGPRFG